MRQRGKLPEFLRLERREEGLVMTYRCQCGEYQTLYANEVEEGTAEVRCPLCSTYVQIRASRETVN